MENQRNTRNSRHGKACCRRKIINSTGDKTSTEQVHAKLLCQLLPRNSFEWVNSFSVHFYFSLHSFFCTLMIQIFVECFEIQNSPTPKCSLLSSFFHTKRVPAPFVVCLANKKHPQEYSSHGCPFLFHLFYFYSESFQTDNVY